LLTGVGRGVHDGGGEYDNESTGLNELVCRGGRGRFSRFAGVTRAAPDRSPPATCCQRRKTCPVPRGAWQGPGRVSRRRLRIAGKHRSLVGGACASNPGKPRPYHARRQGDIKTRSCYWSDTDEIHRRLLAHAP
jgi:hypothetical protein